ncbi:MAG: 6-phosphogluconolactonase [Planctomycetota bacterium]
MTTRSFHAGTVRVHVHPTAAASGAAAAAHFQQAAARILAQKSECNTLFAGAQSQSAFHAALRELPDVDWSRIRAFAIDEFLDPDLPLDCAVAAQPTRDLFKHVRPAQVHVFDVAAAAPTAAAEQFATLLRRHPPDLACLGIGHNGHLALNEPGAARLDDPLLVRCVKLDETTRAQLAADPNFSALPAIPTRGVTLTVPALLMAQTILCCAPSAAKAAVLRRFFQSPVSEDLPASTLKSHPDATLYLDAAAFADSADLFPVS